MLDHPLFGKTTRTLLVMLAALSVPYASPRLRALRPVPAPWEKPEERDPGKASGLSETPRPLASGSQALAAGTNEATIANALPASGSAPGFTADPELAARLKRALPIEDPGGGAMRAFYARLAKTASKADGAKTHILHYGDSVIASDYISGTARRLLQSRYGDAGHGFVLIANPWRWYFHNDVTHHNTEGWEASKLSGPIAMDGLYGLGGVSFHSAAGGIAYFGTAAKGDYGRRVSSFDVYYLEQPNGGDIEVKIRNGETLRIPTRGEKKTSRIHSIKIPDGEAQISLRGGGARLFGVSLERDQGGITYSALGAHAAMAQYWKQMDGAHWAEQMALRDPALIVWQYGTNESDLWRIEWSEYEASLTSALAKLKEAAPNASILVMSPLDRAEQGASGLRTKPVILKLRDTQRRVAHALGLAFWDAFAAMGGEGTMARWVKVNPPLCGGDLTHPTPAGAEVLGTLLVDSLLAGFERQQTEGP